MNIMNLYRKLSKKTVLVNCLFLLLSLSLPIQSSFADDLSSLQKEIKKTKSSQAQQKKKRVALEDSVAKSEQESAAAVLKFQETEEKIAAEEVRNKELAEQTESLNKAQIKQQNLLKQQLISAYMAGQNDLVKLLLNQEDISQIIRAKSYYFYLNKARFKAIETLEETEKQLTKNKQEQEESLASLKSMYDEQKDNKEKLLAQREERSQALKELKQDLNYQSARIAQLSDAEKRLKSTLKKQQEETLKQQELAKDRADEASETQSGDQRHSSLDQRKGELRWPIRGKLLATFGSQRSSQVKWKGVSISANEGEKVRAVATGRVLFAGYFKGYGMVIALDHGDNYITLYGYNQTLLQKTGDVVFQGDAIALAGHTGGQDKNNLYFELSYKGKAQDPLVWLKKRK